MVILLLTTNPELCGSKMEDLVPPALASQSILDSASSSTDFHLLFNIHKFVGIHCLSPDFFTVGAHYKFMFLYCYPNWVFRMDGSEHICSS